MIGSHGDLAYPTVLFQLHTSAIRARIVYSLSLRDAMSLSQTARYAPLPVSENHIRTLTLHAGEVREPIQCTLQIVRLDNDSMYDALSYTWGEPGITEVIQVDAKKVDVTVNLERALR